jgi:hypothetical protein
MAAAVHSAAFAFKWPPSANQSTTSDGAMLAAFPLAGQLVGLREVEDGIWLISFMHYDLGYIDLEQKTFQPIDNPFGTRLSPISQEQVVTCVSGSDDRPLGGEGVRRSRLYIYEVGDFVDVPQIVPRRPEPCPVASDRGSSWGGISTIDSSSGLCFISI